MCNVPQSVLPIPILNDEDNQPGRRSGSASTESADESPTDVPETTSIAVAPVPVAEDASAVRRSNRKSKVKLHADGEPLSKLAKVSITPDAKPTAVALKTKKNIDDKMADPLVTAKKAAIVEPIELSTLIKTEPIEVCENLPINNKMLDTPLPLSAYPILNMSHVTVSSPSTGSPKTTDVIAGQALSASDPKLGKLEF